MASRHRLRGGKRGTYEWRRLIRPSCSPWATVSDLQCTPQAPAAVFSGSLTGKVTTPSHSGVMVTATFFDESVQGWTRFVETLALTKGSQSHAVPGAGQCSVTLLK